MRNFDHDYVEEVIRRLGRITPDAKPAWGKLTRQGMIQHLADSVRYSMGRLGDVPDRSNWVLRKVIAPLILNEIIRLPRNLPAPPYPKRAAQDDLETLHALLEEYLGLVQAGEFAPKRNSALGDIGVDGWAKMHLVHFEHHMRQFGV
jgi:oxepin-CoA hydrolase/3-oxo-5,6-dehydrosuberyl-CoA semialdehyde dehydrogenase